MANEDVIIVPRGLCALVKKMNSVVKSRAGVEYYCMDTKDQFDLFPSNRPVEVFDKENILPKKFIREFLTFEKNISNSPRKVVKAVPSK